MYLHIGNGIVVRQSDIVAVFDLDNTSQSYRTRQYLARAEKSGAVVNVSEGELPKSFVVCAEGNGKQTVYLSLLNSSTLLRRSENINLE